MEPKRVESEAVLRKYTRLPKDRKCLILDVRPQKEFKRRHLLLSYCIRLTSNGKALADYSKNLYDLKWTQVTCSLRVICAKVEKAATLLLGRCACSSTLQSLRMSDCFGWPPTMQPAGMRENQ